VFPEAIPGAPHGHGVCKTVLFPAQVGLVLYNLGGHSASSSALTTFADTAKKFDAASATRSAHASSARHCPPTGRA
jgi:hypothetical protein